MRWRCDGAALELLFAPAQCLGWQQAGCVQLGRGMGWAMAGAPGEHPLFCGCAEAAWAVLSFLALFGSDVSPLCGTKGLD